MELYWEEHKLGLQLILSTDERNEVMGRIRRTKDGGYNVNARAFGYNPERAAMGMASLDEAKAFVESFRTWEELVGPSDLAVEDAVRPPTRRCNHDAAFPRGRIALHAGGVTVGRGHTRGQAA